MACRSRRRVQLHAQRAVAFALGGAVVLSALSCKKSGDDTALARSDWSLSPDPPRVGPTRLSFELKHAGASRPCAEVAVEANMTHPGMTPVLSQARQVRDGSYEAAFEFTMAGDWYLKLTCTAKEGQRLERLINPVSVGAK